jgi:hypothetical protein
MKLPPSAFWTWFQVFAKRIPNHGIADELQNELLSHLQCYDRRLYFQICTNATPRELIITAEGNADAFPSADELVTEAPVIAGWKFISLKPAMGFDFCRTDGVITLDVSKLWFIPTTSNAAPSKIGVIIGFPDADFVLKNQSVVTAYTIL